MRRLKNMAILALCAILFVLPVVQAVGTSIPLYGVAWNHNPTVYISLQKGVDPALEDEVIDALDEWATNFRGHFILLSTPPTKKNPADITITLKKNWGNVLGSTSIRYSGSTIISATITVATKNAMGLPLDATDVFSITAHELGHALGLGHATDDGVEPIDLMYPYFDFVGSNARVYPSSLDVKAVRAIYGTNGFLGDNPNPGGTVYP